MPKLLHQLLHPPCPNKRVSEIRAPLEDRGKSTGSRTGRRVFYMFLNIKRIIFEYTLDTPTPRRSDISAMYPKFHRVKFVIIPTYFIQQLYLLNIALQPTVGCSAYKLKKTLFGLLTTREKNCETGLFNGGLAHDDAIKWKHFPRYWPFVRGIRRSRWIPRTKASDAELWCFLWSAPE